MFPLMAQSLKVILSPNAKCGEVLCTSNFPGHRSEPREPRQIRVCSWADKTDLSGEGASSLCLTDAVGPGVAQGHEENPLVRPQESQLRAGTKPTQ